jgi:IclR family transcriptional regulator, KDG regulon repressor
MIIQSVNRALQILSLFSYRKPLLGVSEISRLLNLTKPTVHALIRTLVAQGFLHQDSYTKKYRLGLKLYELGIVLGGTLEINQKATSPAHQLAKKAQLISRVGIWDGDSMLVTLIAYPWRTDITFSHQLGPRTYAHCSAIGKAVLAFLEEQELKNYLDRTKLIQITASTITSHKDLLSELKDIRERGYSIDNEETMQGLACIGAPIFEHGGSVIGSISLSGDPSVVLGNQMEYFTKELKNTASEISQYMGYFPSVMDAQIP